MNIDVLRARLAESETVLRSIHTEAGSADLNEDQMTRWESAEAERDGIVAEIAAAEAEVARRAKVAADRARWGSVSVAPVRTDPFDLGTLRGVSGDDLVNRARSAFEDRRSIPRGTSDASVQELLRKIDHLSLVDELADDSAPRQAEDLARYVLVHGSDAYRSAFKSWLHAAMRGNAPVMTVEESMAVRASMSLTSANGGYALPTLLDPSLIHTGTATKNPVRRISRNEFGTQDKWNGVTVGGVTTYWKGEGSAFTDGSPTTGAVQVDAAQLTAYVTGSYEIFQDSNLLSQLPGLIGEAMDYAEGTAFISGSGSDAPKGIITCISATVASTVTVTTRGSFTSASTADTLALLAAPAVRYEDSSTWLMNKATYRTIAQQVTGTAGVKLIEMTDRNNLLDLPVVRSSDMPSATTSGNILAVLGDFQQFIVYDRLGVNVEVISNVVDGDGNPVGKRGLVAYKRVGSNTSDINAFRFLKA